MSQPTFGIAITAADNTDKGAKAAEKRLGQIPKHVGVATDRAARESERSFGRGAKGIVRTFGEVERAGARALGGRSLTAGLTSRLGALNEAAGAVGTGLGDAAAAGGVLSGALGVVGVAAGATIGILAAAAYGAFRLADSWAKGAAGIGRTADIIGVSTKALQEFSAAAERAGVDKDKATGSLGGLSQNLNDARYGRNTGALAVLGRLGVQMKTNADGTVDVGAMLPTIATAIQRQNSSGRRTAAKGLGISLDTLPAFSQGGAALSADMKDADSHAVVLSQDEIAKGTRIARKSVRVGQLKDVAVSAAGSGAASLAEPGYDTVLRGGTAIVDGARNFAGSVDRSFKPAAEKIDRAADKLLLINARGGAGAGPSLSPSLAENTRSAMRYYEKQGHTRGQSAGIVAGLIRESNLDPRRVGDSGLAYGIGQWHPDRQADFKRVFGKDMRGSSYGEQLAFSQWELTHTRKGAGQRLDRSVTPYESGGVVSRYYEGPKDRAGEMHRRGLLAEQIAAMPELPVKLEIEFKNAPAGTKAKARSGRRANPAVSHAMTPYMPVHGG